MEWMKIDPDKKRSSYTDAELKAIQTEGENRLKFLIDTLRDSGMPRDQITVGAIMALAVSAFVDFSGENIAAALDLFGNAWSYATGDHIAIIEKPELDMPMAPTSGKVH